MKHFLLLALILLSTVTLVEQLPPIVKGEALTDVQRIFEELRVATVGGHDYLLDAETGAALTAHIEAITVSRHEVTLHLVTLAAAALVISLIVLVLGRRKDERLTVTKRT